MSRVTNAVASHRRRKKIRKKAKGFVGDRKNHCRLTKEAVMRSMSFNYIHRKQKKREFRSLWISRISIGAKICGISYNKLVHGLKLAKIAINRKFLADLVVSNKNAFAQIAEKAKAKLQAVA